LIPSDTPTCGCRRPDLLAPFEREALRAVATAEQQHPVMYADVTIEEGSDDALFCFSQRRQHERTADAEPDHRVLDEDPDDMDGTQQHGIQSAEASSDRRRHV